MYLAMQILVNAEREGLKDKKITFTTFVIIIPLIASTVFRTTQHVICKKFIRKGYLKLPVASFVYV